MSATQQMRRYQAQAVNTSTPEQLIAKLFDYGVSACHTGDRGKVRAVLRELIGSLNMEAGGDLAPRLYTLYDFCMRESVDGSLASISEVLDGLRVAWKEHVVGRRAA